MGWWCGIFNDWVDIWHDHGMIMMDKMWDSGEIYMDIYGTYGIDGYKKMGLWWDDSVRFQRTHGMKETLSLCLCHIGKEAIATHSPCIDSGQIRISSFPKNRLSLIIKEMVYIWWVVMDFVIAANYWQDEGASSGIALGHWTGFETFSFWRKSSK